MIFILFLILVMLCLPYFKLGERANLIIAIIAIVLAVLIIFFGWEGNFPMPPRARVD